MFKMFSCVKGFVKQIISCVHVYLCIYVDVYTFL